MIRLTVRLLKWVFAAYLVMTAALLAWTFLWPEPDMADTEQADVMSALVGA